MQDGDKAIDKEEFARMKEKYAEIAVIKQKIEAMKEDERREATGKV